MQIIKAIPKLKQRPTASHKGDFGKVCIIAGSVEMPGAAALAGRTALRAGAGLVKIATAQSAQPIVAAIEPCFTTERLNEDSAGRISVKSSNQILTIIEENDVIAFGPGVGISNGLKSIAETLIAHQNLRLIIDADGLNNLSKAKGWPKKIKANLIMTPHPGEMKRLWKSLFREPLPSERQKQAQQLAECTKSVVILKGAGTVVTDGDKIYINKTGNPAMATAGCGDVLTGVLTALCGQGLDNFEAAVLSVYIHGLAGDIASKTKGQVGLIATDIIEALPQAFMQN